MTRNAAHRSAGSGGGPWVGGTAGWRPARTIVLVGLMGAGKSAIGRRLAARLGLPFHDADAEIERAAGYSVSELFSLYGEASFRDGERRVIARLLAGELCVLATGGGAFMDPRTRAAIRKRAMCVWLRADLATLLRRTAGRTHRPLLARGDPQAILEQLMQTRHPTYAEADVTIDCGDDSLEATTERVVEALAAHAPLADSGLLDRPLVDAPLTDVSVGEGLEAPLVLHVALGAQGYDVVTGSGLLGQAGRRLAPLLPQPRVVIVTDSNVAPLHLSTLQAALADAGIAVAGTAVVPAGEASKSLAQYAALVEQVLGLGVERRTSLIALGGGVIGDLAGFVAATVLRGLPFVQIPTTLLAQVDSSVGGKTGINTDRGKNLCGAFYQPIAVLADTDVLTTLPVRELRAGYAEILKAGLIADAALYGWCEAHGGALIGGDAALRAEAIGRACAFKAAVVGADERETQKQGGRALLNLGHTFAHALEAELGYGSILHGEAVGIGLGLAFRLSAELGLCDPAIAPRIEAHLESVGLPPTLDRLNRRLSAGRLAALFGRDKKMRDGRLTFVLARGIGAAFTGEAPEEAVLRTLRAAGCGA